MVQKIGCREKMSFLVYLLRWIAKSRDFRETRILLLSSDEREMN
jgi:hypothetical protein